nr:immunoglobulin light chain junction region [Macaca mulatta]
FIIATQHDNSLSDVLF